MSNTDFNINNMPGNILFSAPVVPHTQFRVALTSLVESVLPGAALHLLPSLLEALNGTLPAA